MSYLYGDSSASELQLNFIDFLKDVMDFSVQVLVADRHIREGVERGLELRRNAEAEEGRLESLGSTVANAVERATLGEADSATSRCAETLLRSSAELVRGEAAGVKSRLAMELGQLDEVAARERNNCVHALSTLLLLHDLPDWTVELGLEWQGGHYVAQLRAQTSFGLQVAIELGIAANHLAAHIIRLDKFAERLEVHAPEEGGWLRKEVKLRPQRLEKEYLTSLQIGAGETTLKLRANPDGTGAGFDLSVRAEAPRVRLTRTGEHEGAPFELNDADAERVIELQEKLLVACADLAQSRKAVVEASLDGTPISQHTNPKLVAERLIETITPTVKEIMKHSLSPTELVLKRQLDGGRREEIFVSRDELKQKLAPLDAVERGLFAPLGLADPAPKKAEPIKVETVKVEPAARPIPLTVRVSPAVRAPRVTPAPIAEALGGDAEEITESNIITEPPPPEAQSAPAKQK